MYYPSIFINIFKPYLKLSLNLCLQRNRFLSDFSSNANITCTLYWSLSLSLCLYRKCVSLFIVILWPLFTFRTAWKLSHMITLYNMALLRTTIKRKLFANIVCRQHILNSAAVVLCFRSNCNRSLFRQNNYYCSFVIALNIRDRELLCRVSMIF
jgi:hypothetical protein